MFSENVAKKPRLEAHFKACLGETIAWSARITGGKEEALVVKRSYRLIPPCLHSPRHLVVTPASACPKQLPSSPTPPTSSPVQDIPAKCALLNVRSLSYKTFILNDFISVAQLDILFLTETWLKPGDQAQLLELCPPKYDSFSSPRTTGRGEDIKKNLFKCCSITFKSFSSFETLMLKICCSEPILCVAIYRLPYPNAVFMSEFSDLMVFNVLNYDKAILVGDFNIPREDPSNRFATQFKYYRVL